MALVKKKGKQKKMSKFWGCSISILIFVIILIVLSSIKVPLYGDYVNNKHGIKLQYQVNWSYMNDPLDGSIVVFQSFKEHELDTFYENVNIAKQDFGDEPATLTEFAKTMMTNMETVFKGQIDVLESKIRRVGDKRTYRLVYATVGDDHELVRYQHDFIIVGNTGYIITYVAHLKDFKKFIPQVNTMVRTFEVVY